jgi:hypothetical protein
VVTISPCLLKKQLKLFERIPELLHQNDPFFIPPFPGSIVKLIGPKSPFWRHGEVFPLIAYREGKPVGRIAAVINRAHNEYYNDKTGFFGFFDCIHDEEVARALFDAAKKIIRERGLERIRGPYNPTQNDECGLLVEGFDTTPYVMMPYNPAYYLELYEKVGLEKARDLYAYYMSAAEGSPEKVKRVADRVKTRTGLQFRNLNLKNLDSELRIIAELYNATLCRNWGFIPITYEDLKFSSEDLKNIVDPTMILFAEKDGEPVGFSMTIPNVNEFMWKAKKYKSTLMRILSFIWLLKTQHPKEARLAVLGVKPEYQASGAAAVFYHETLNRGKQQYIGGELSWVEESNKEIERGIALMGGKRYKTYRIFEASLGAIS